MKKRKAIIPVVLLILLVAGAWWAFGRRDAQVLKVKQMQNELFASGKPPAREAFEKFRKEMDKLSPDQRRQVMGRGPGDRMRKDMDEYFKLPKDERTAYLRKQIEEMEKRRAEMETKGPPNGPPPDGSGPRPGANGPGPGGPPGDGPGGPGGGRGGPGGGPGGPGGRDPAKQRSRLAGMLGHTSPSERAKFSNFHDAMAKERIAMGLSPMPAPPGRPPSQPPK